VAVAVQTYLLLAVEQVVLQAQVAVVLEKDLDQVELESNLLVAVAAELNMILRQVAAVPAEKV
tara:strand:+ start:246 stop:434 length:189 start_codon:yes stop_codon:yes gene_type:complete